MARAAEAVEREPIVFTFNSDAQALGHFDLWHRLVLLGGGLGSGKTVLHGLDIIRRAPESDQLGGIFTNTQATLEKGVIPEIEKIHDLAGMERPVFDRRPPQRWFKRWVHQKIEIPRIARYRNILTSPNGVHVLCGTLHNQSFHQFETIQFGWIRIEEAINNALLAITTMLERVRCSLGGADSRERCRKFHHHTRHLVFNPPPGAHPWLKGLLTQLEDAARDHYHELGDGETCDCSKHHGPVLDHSRFPLLQAGIGDAILIRSRTSDNAANLDDGYESGLAANMSKGTALRRLEGEIIFATDTRTYDEWSNDNLHGIRYDPDRTLYMTLDFNLEPRAAGFWQPLNPGEYPAEHQRTGLSHIGKFGEYFYAGEMSDRRFAQDLIKGGRGSGCDSQPRYRSEQWRGLPQACDETCEKICKRGHWNGLRAHRGRIVAFGDQRGTHRSSHGDNLESSWDIVDQEFRKLENYGKNVPEDQPSPRARVDSVNGKLCNTLGQRSAWVDRRCEETIRDFEQVQWDDTGMALREWRRGAVGTEWHRTHLTDGDGYMIHRLFPLGHEIDPMASIPTGKLPPRTKAPSFLR